MNVHHEAPATSRMLAWAIMATAFCTSSTAHAQNLVPNPGFEETDTCTFGLGLGALHYWHSAYLTPDHLQSCQPYGSANGLPMNTWTYQQPFEGTSCLGIGTYILSDEQREWIMVPLLDTLVPGQAYYCSFRANAGFGGNLLHPTIWLASNHLGMLFTTYDRHWAWGDPYPEPLNYAHILHSQILSDTVGWTLVSGSFVADSAYTSLMIGNFFSNAQTDTVRFADPANVEQWYDNGYTLVDAVCVSPTPNGCESSHGIEDAAIATLIVFPNPATDALLIGNAAGRVVEVLDMLGQSVWRGRLNTDNYSLGVEGWARGVYLLQVRGNSGVEVVKFVLAE